MLISLRRMLLALLLPIILLTSFAQSQNSFTPGRAWLDETRRAGFQSHSGGLLFERREFITGTGWTTGGREFRRILCPNRVLPGF